MELGYDNTSEVMKVYSRAYNCYWSPIYACAYLEKKYKVIFDEYRNGKPGMPAQFVENLPPLRNKELTQKEVGQVIKMREEENAIFKKIAQELFISILKAKHTYNWYYKIKLLELLENLESKTKTCEEYKNICHTCYGNNLSDKARYDMLIKKYFCS